MQCGKQTKALIQSNEFYDKWRKGEENKFYKHQFVFIALMLCLVKF